jgi:thiol-disulfide isomerase/thioredoxin
MKSVSWMSPVLALGLVTAQSAEQWFPAGQPELLASHEALIPLMTWSEYAALAANLRGPRQVVLSERPPLSDRARFGVNFVLGGRNRSLAVDGSDEAGYRFYADIDGNGRLTDDEMLPMTRVAGNFTARFNTNVTETVGSVSEAYPVEMTFTIGTAIPPGATEPIPVLRRRGTTVRRGVVQLSGVNVAFALLGQAGIYNHPSATVVFDLRGGGLDLTDSTSPDRFQVGDGKVTIAGVTYAFRVDRYGRGLALSTTDRPMPARPTLDVGSAAPEFTFIDLDGVSHRLSDFRGRVVLLVFWATWCAPCRAEAPTIAKVYELFKDQGLVVVGMNANDPLPDVRQFIEQFQVAGMTTREPIDGPVHKLFRVRGWPAHFLIGKDGRIVAKDIEASGLGEAVAAAIKAERW